MTVRKALIPSLDRRSMLLFGASLTALAHGLSAAPASGQSLSGMLGGRSAAPRPPVQAPNTVTPRRPATMTEALARQRSTQSRTQQTRDLILAAQQAARAANQGGDVPDGLATGGLDPTSLIREAVAAAKAGDTVRAGQLLVSARAINDPTGVATWEGAGLPTQTAVDGRAVVSIDQTQQRALLSWNSFNIGANTTLQFNQRENGVARPDWVAVNRVTNAVAPSRILGNLRADGTVVVLNQNGILFGANSQVNTHSLLASTLELGAAVRLVSSDSERVRGKTVQERNAAFLENGLFGPASGTTAQPLLVSANAADGEFANESTVRLVDQIEGSVAVAQGARISSGTGGFLILAAPAIDSDGVLSAVDGQVSLQAGRAIIFQQSTGAGNDPINDPDPNVRGFKLITDTSRAGQIPSNGTISVSGLIDSRRGYLSLGTAAQGSVTIDGMLSSTTSVSRNGKIAISAGTVTIAGNADPARAGVIEIRPDASGEIIPQGSADAPSGFKSSQLEIFAPFVNADPTGPRYISSPTTFVMGTNAVIYAPNADVSVGGTTASVGVGAVPNRIDIGSGAIIDVSGIKDVQLDASRNQLLITPVKRNELRDTPNYREVALDGNFSLNGATLYIDPRLSGVRADGVAWIGSPLIEAGSLAGQIPASAAEFMTRGGTVNLFNNFDDSSVTGLDPAAAPSVKIARDARIDISGGWVNYAAGAVRTSRLVTDDGRIVDIANADPNDVYVAVADGFTEIQPRFGVLRTYLNAAASGERVEASYDEGRDAGRLTINAPAVTFDGAVHANAFAGSRQIADGDRPSRASTASTVAGDARTLQRAPYELPSGGALSIATRGDMIVYHGNRGAADTNRSELLLSDSMLSAAGLSALNLAATGTVTFAGANPVTLQSADALTITGPSHLTLAPGGRLDVIAGRTIRFDGTVEAASGTIAARTSFDFGGAYGSLFRTGLQGQGGGDDIVGLFTPETLPTSPFDVVVAGTLSTAGLWVNDFTEAEYPRGGAFADGGRISLAVAPRVFIGTAGSINAETQAGDLSGSLRISGSIDVSSGGYVSPTGALDLSGRGGDVTLLNETTYASIYRTSRDVGGSGTGSDRPIGGGGQSVDFTPLPAEGVFSAVVPQLVPEPRSVVEIAPGSIRGFGFAGGGTFTLFAPDVSFGSDVRPGATHIGLDFFATTGFGTLDVTSYRSRIVPDIFTNASTNNSAFFETTRFVVGRGEKLDLTQWVLPSVLTSGQAAALRGLGTGADLSSQSFLAPTLPGLAWDRRAANLVLGGLTELDVMAGGEITGTPGASITTAKLYNAGSIVLRGGTISQRADLLPNLVSVNDTLGVRDAALGGDGLADAFGGTVDAQGRFDEDAVNAAGIVDPTNPGRLLTNRELVSREGADRLIHFLGILDVSEGIRLDSGSVTDLSGIALLDPRAPAAGNGAQIRRGRVLAGGTLQTAAPEDLGARAAFVFPSNPAVYAPPGGTPGFSVGAVTAARTLIRRDDAVLDISGASAVFDQAMGAGVFVPAAQWSAAGTVSAGAGGTLGRTPIAARGGASQAEGGTLEWLRPTVGGASATMLPLDYLPVDMIAGSGFDTLIARGSLRLDGDFSLSLRKGLLVTSQAPTSTNITGTDAQVTISATAGTNATLGAAYVRFDSRVADVGNAGMTPAGDAAVKFAAGRLGIDVSGGILFDRSIAALTLSTPADVRLTGVNAVPGTNSDLPSTITGALVAGGDLTIDARRTYATTGTGNYQHELEGLPEGPNSITAPYRIAALGDHRITFGNTYLDPNAPAPLSAGSRVQVLAKEIVQNGYLAAPLGSLELGSNSATSVANLTVAPTESVTFGAGSVTTVSGVGLNIPYGTTTDGLEYFFPTIAQPISVAPAGRLQLAGASIVQAEGALIDGRGGGDIFAYEFQSGVGGSRDVLDRFNRDAFSSNDFDPVTGIGFQYADHRQVFALVPVSQIGSAALYDPIYSADYGTAGPVDLYGRGAGLSITLDAAPGIAAGEYMLLPAKYAMAIPGALRVVENSGASGSIPGQSATLLDGSIVVGGRYSYAGTGIAESERRSFTVQSKDTFLDYSQILTTSGSKAVTDRAARKDLARPRLPLDAARVILSPLTELRLAGAFDTRAASGGQGGQFDILGANIVIASEGAEATEGALTLTDSALSRLNATSLLIGGRRSDNADGSTTLSATASAVEVRGGATLQAPELLLVAGGAGSRVTIADGAVLNATGELGTQPSGDYAIATGGSLVRLASGNERLVSRTGTGQSTIEIGAATITGSALALDSSGAFAISDQAAIDVSNIALSGGAIRFEDGDAGAPGVIGSNLEAKLAAADRLTIRSPGAVRFSAGNHRFNDLVIDSATLASTAGTGADEAVTITAANVRLANAANAADGCLAAGFCGLGGSFALDAQTIAFGANDVRVAGVADSVTLGAAQGMYVEGKGRFLTGDASLTLRTPFLADRAAAADPRNQTVRPDYTFLTTGDFAMIAPAVTGAVPTPQGNAAPASRIAIGGLDAPVRSVRIEGSRIRATAGIIDIRSGTDIALAGATLDVPGYNVTFGDAVDPVTISAGGGTINLVALQGDLTTDARTTLISDTGQGSAGTINLLAGNGAITFDAAINPGVTGARGGSFAFDTAESAFDLAGFVGRSGHLFGGDIWIRSGAGNLDLNAGQTVRAKNVTLTADGGAIGIAGTIDTSGVNVAGLSADAARNADVNGGDIALWGAAGVTLASTARLDTHTTGYADTDSRAATAGDVTIGIAREDAAINIANGAIIDVGARRTQAAAAVGESGGRLIPQTVTNPATQAAETVYYYAEPDKGGTVHLRAPVIGAAGDRVAVSIGGAIQGADSIQLEAFRRYDLDAIAASGLYSGISTANGGLVLNMAQSSADGGRFNPFTENFTLADGTPSVVRFVQDFGVSTVDGSSLQGIRLRPGVELAAAGDLATQTQWNLAAATFSPEQLAAAVAAGDLTVIDEISTGGVTRYAVTPGREGHLLDSFTTFLYRTGGTARGEAPVVTMRAGGDLTINRSISDGFFTFRDRSDPAWMNYQLGGGDRAYSPGLSFRCGTGADCSGLAGFTPGTMPPASQIVTIALNAAAQQGDISSGNEFINSPLAVTGNGAAGNGDASDPLGFAELFPLLPDNGVIHSSDLRLVAGAGDGISANPLLVDRARDADVTVGGEYSYRVQVTNRNAVYGGSLQFRLQGLGFGEAPVSFDIGDTLNLPEMNGLDQLRDDTFTQINWGNAAIGLGAEARAAAAQYFAGRPGTFVGPANARTGIVAPLSEVIGFLQSFEPTYQSGLASRRPGYTTAALAQPINFGAANSTYVRSYVRTGDGSIDVAAARDIDLRGSPTPVYRQENGNQTATPSGASVQFAGAAIYTAGVRVAPTNVDARIVGGGARIAITPDSPYLSPRPELVEFIPSPKALSDIQPVLARGGGDVALDAGRDVLGRRDIWSEFFLGEGRLAGQVETSSAGTDIGLGSQRWRTGIVGLDTEIGIAPRYFSSGVGALGGGDVTIDAGRDISELSVAIDSSVTTAPTSAGVTMLTFGGGELAVSAGRDILAGRYDVATGAGTIHADRDIAGFGTEPIPGSTIAQYMRVRLTDAVVDVSAGGAATLATVSALGVDPSSLASANAVGFFSPTASFSLTATETTSILETDAGPIDSNAISRDFGKIANVVNGSSAIPQSFIQVLPPSFAMTSLAASIFLPTDSSTPQSYASSPRLLFPSPIGQLRLFSQGDINSLLIAMSDADPSLLGGAFGTPTTASGSVPGLPYQIPAVGARTTDAQLRLQHNRRTTHLGDPEPARIYSNGDINLSAIFLPKQGRITAGGDIIDMFFVGQNAQASDVTRIRAGGDILGTLADGGSQDDGSAASYIRSGNFILGGPGTLIVEAGRNLGPFVTSATTGGTSVEPAFTFAGGIRTIGNDYNPWLADAGADLSIRFGMAAGADYAALRETYLNPANADMLDGDLFAQVVDSFGNRRPDRSRPIYAPMLAEWLRENEPALFASLFANQSYPDTAAGNTALAQASYGRLGDLHTAFAGLDPLRQQDFLINDLYFNELAQPAIPDGPSYQQYVRGYRAVQTLFPTRLGYTDNLAPYTLDPTTVSADHPLGEPVRNIVNGQPQIADRIVTGNVDLRLATLQTGRGGNVNILGPGGDVIAGSVVRTSDQVFRRKTAFNGGVINDVSGIRYFLPSQLEQGRLRLPFAPGSSASSIRAIPLGYEGVLTLQGGRISAFTDGDFILNQSRLFTQQGGDITMWSSNGDLNAGQGPKSASNFPPITVRLDIDGEAQVNSAGSVAGAGIGAFKRTPDDPPADIILVAPVGEIDAGDAGVRASGNVLVAAARVANADNFSAAGEISGVPSGSVTAGVATPAEASSAIAAQVAGLTNANRDRTDRRSLITVDVLGPAGDGRCPEPGRADDPDCSLEADQN
jgi:filamentous hemagglutinin family protein